MTRLIRWLLAVALGAGVVSAAPGAAAAPSARRGACLDGLQLRYLLPGLGTSTDFEYEYDDVAFVARVWESGSDATGWRVDLHVDVMRGDRLTDARALHDWFIPYEDRPAGEVSYRRVRIHGHPGWLTRDEVFWLVRPGLAIAMTIDGSRYTTGQVLRAARAARIGCGGGTQSAGSSGPLAEAMTRSISQNARRETILPSAFTR